MRPACSVSAMHPLRGSGVEPVKHGNVQLPQPCDCVFRGFIATLAAATRCLPHACRLYKGLPPLWGRQIPYTMMKFACFENTVEALYKYVVPKPKSQCSKSEQLGVSFVAGYIAGVFCAVVSQPADNMVSKLNSQPGATIGSESPPLAQPLDPCLLFPRRFVQFPGLERGAHSIRDGSSVLSSPARRVVPE